MLPYWFCAAHASGDVAGVVLWAHSKTIQNKTTIKRVACVIGEGRTVGLDEGRASAVAGEAGFGRVESQMDRTDEDEVSLFCRARNASASVPRAFSAGGNIKNCRRS